MTAYITTSNAIVHEFLDDEVIIANLNTGCYFSIRGTGIPVWEWLISGVDSSVIASRLESHYDGLPPECESDIDVFINTITADGLLIATETSDPDIGTEPEVHFPETYRAPIIERYDEMTDLLMLDPVHEVDTQGWPKRPSTP